MGALDIAARGLLQTAPREVAQWLLGPGTRVVNARTEETQHVARERRLDKLVRVRLSGERDLLRLHLEVAARWRSDIPRRTHEAWTLCDGPRRPTLSIVLVLKPDRRQRRAPAEELVIRVRGRPILRFKFQVIRMWTVDARELLRSGPPALLPFLPYARGASSSRVRAAFTKLGELGGPRGGELKSALAVLATDVFPDFDWLGMIPEEIGMEKKNRVIEAWIAQGELLCLRRIVARQLRLRLHDRARRLVRRLDRASRTALRKASDLIVTTPDDDELISQLTSLLFEPARKKAIAR